MPERLRERATYANVTATLALVVAVGGTGAWAADKITSKDIAKNAVRAKHIKSNAVRTTELKNASVVADKLADGAVSEGKLAGGAVTSGKLAGGAVTSAAVVGCPAGTQLVDGLCWDSVATAQLSWANASDDCSDRGGRLPSIGELVAAKDTPGFDYGVGGSLLNHYSDTVYLDDGTLGTAVVAEDATFVAAPQSADQDYRCVFERIR